MLNLTLRRFHRTPTATLGALLGSQGVVCQTLELPFLDNAPRISCIPNGLFVATRCLSPRFGDTFDVAVPGRSLIRFHRGNTPRDSEGCIILVSGFIGEFGTNSVAAQRRFREELSGVLQFRLLVESVM